MKTWLLEFLHANKIYYYFTIFTVAMLILSPLSYIFSGGEAVEIAYLLIFPVWIVFTIVVLLKKVIINHTNSPQANEQSPATQINSINTIPTISSTPQTQGVSKFLTMFLFPFRTLEENRSNTIDRTLQELFLLSLLPAVGSMFEYGISKVALFSIFFRRYASH